MINKNKDMITIQKQELQELIKTSVQNSLSEYFPKYDYVSNEEQQEIENLHSDILDDKFDKNDYTEI